MKHIEKFNEIENNDDFYQDNFTRNPNGLLFKMKELFNNKELTNWEYTTFLQMVDSFAREHNLYFDIDKKQLLKK